MSVQYGFSCDKQPLKKKHMAGKKKFEVSDAGHTGVQLHD
jgi:hypothetical protein